MNVAYDTQYDVGYDTTCFFKPPNKNKTDTPMTTVILWFYLASHIPKIVTVKLAVITYPKIALLESAENTFI